MILAVIVFPALLFRPCGQQLSCFFFLRFASFSFFASLISWFPFSSPGLFLPDFPGFCRISFIFKCFEFQTIHSIANLPVFVKNNLFFLYNKIPYLPHFGSDTVFYILSGVLPAGIFSLLI